MVTFYNLLGTRLRTTEFCIVAIPTLKFLRGTCENILKIPKFCIVSDAIHSGLESLREWYRKADDTDVYLGESDFVDL